MSFTRRQIAVAIVKGGENSEETFCLADLRRSKWNPHVTTIEEELSFVDRILDILWDITVVVCLVQKCCDVFMRELHNPIRITFVDWRRDKGVERCSREGAELAIRCEGGGPITGIVYPVIYRLDTTIVLRCWWWGIALTTTGVTVVLVVLVLVILVLVVLVLVVLVFLILLLLVAVVFLILLLVVLVALVLVLTLVVAVVVAASFQQCSCGIAVGWVARAVEGFVAAADDPPGR